jgi:hypothetical protein
MKIQKQIGASLTAAGLLACVASVQAQPTAHYVPGVEGIKAASLPPPGFYLRDYNVGYYSSRLNDASGNSIDPVDPNLWIYANVPRVIWITDLKLLGGYIGVDALAPFQYTDVEINTPNGRVESSDFAVADPFVEATWSAHTKKFDFAIGYGAWMPFGESEQTLDYWTHMITAGATWYPDSEKLWSASILNRYEINTKQEDTGITYGDAWTIEYGIARAVSKTVELGVVGYWQKQMSASKSEGSATGYQDPRDWVVGIGPEIGVMYPKYKLGWNLRYVYEITAENRFQGHTAALTITKIF